MFTGLIETMGRVQRVQPGAGMARLTIAADLPTASMRDGESVAVDGVCLTVVRRKAGGFAADVVAETLKRTTLGQLRAGDGVHLERALALGDRLGGHLVQGHVDAVSKVLALRKTGNDVRLSMSLPAEVRGLVARKGSIAVNGVSLTVSAVRSRSFEVALIPETIARTKLGGLKPGQGVNLEADVIARYLEALMDERRR